ncbi:MAG: glutamine-hydrolyzing GMP synthase [Oscillospiraceae bacterium]|nr:glutamine-hydrolyzing GMP synthase [Oscillospiraceae bacterium]MDD4414412.1 glutamine-hydrolyzing GMP synthase [Oscillospiraceae bacterium]
MHNEKVLVLDFGGQYNQLIARRVREAGVYSVVLPYNTPLEEIRAAGYKGIILTGDPNKVNDDESWQYTVGILELSVPVLGICYGARLMARLCGGRVESEGREHLPIVADIDIESRLFKGLDKYQQCRMSDAEYVSDIPDGFKAIATTSNCSCAAMEDEAHRLYAVQFHPELMHTENGIKMLKNFLFEICDCRGDWEMSSFVQAAVENIRGQIGGKRVLCALSGGVDSSVAAVMVAKAVGSQLTCIFVDHGLLRKNEGDMVQKMFTENYDIYFIRVNAQKRFLDKLAGVTDPEKKRKIIGEEFIRVFEEEANKLGEIEYLVQGTIYPDIIESGSDKSAVIKSHHNVGGLPERMNLKLCEPLRDLFKDEVRRAGLELGLPEYMVWRQPFPGPGLAVRCIGAITVEKLDILREADAIFREEIENAGLGQDINQYFAIITDMRSVGITQNVRTYDYTIALRAVKTTDFMTAEWARIPLDVLAKASNRIVSEVKGVNRIVYDITSKPPATIEWE